MADFSFSLTIPDNRVNDLVDALRWKFGDEGATAAQLKGMVKTMLIDDLKEINRDYKAHLANKGIGIEFGMT